MPDLAVRDLTISFPGLGAPVIDIAALDVAAGARVAVTGPSGSGKSTLINLLVGLERPARGSVRWGDTDLATLSEARRDAFRAANIGLVMQDFHLFPGLSALENVLLPARFRRLALDRAIRGRAEALIARVGLKRPGQRIETMSRGEMQRVAVARALVMEPSVLVADEPTASLDAAAGAVVADLLVALAAEAGATLIAVTHDAALADRLDRRLGLAAGRIVADSLAPPATPRVEATA